MTIRELLAELQRLPRDAELLAFEAAARTIASARSTRSSSRAAGSTCILGPGATSDRGASGPYLKILDGTAG
jgi:hypothetical protein